MQIDVNSTARRAKPSEYYETVIHMNRDDLIPRLVGVGFFTFLDFCSISNPVFSYYCIIMNYLLNR